LPFFEEPELPGAALPPPPVFGIGAGVGTGAVFFAAFLIGFVTVATFLTAFFGAGLEDVLVDVLVLDVLFIRCILKLTFQNSKKILT